MDPRDQAEDDRKGEREMDHAAEGRAERVDRQRRRVLPDVRFAVEEAAAALEGDLVDVVPAG